MSVNPATEERLSKALGDLGAAQDMITQINMGSGGGSSSTFGNPFPATGTAVGFIDSGGNLAGANLDASGYLKVNVSAGSSGNAAASATGSAVPASGDYGAINVSGTLRGQTGVNPSGSVYAAQMDIASMNGVSVTMGNGVAGTGVQRVCIASDNTAFSVNAVQSGTWNVTNISGTVSLPTGAATAAKQPALGTAGTASSDVITVQGITSMTPLLVTMSGSNTVATVTSLSQWAGNAIDTNSGTKSAGTLRVVLATDQPALTNKLLVTPDLPSGASTAAKQPALGAAGSASTDVITVQGITSMVALKVDGSAVTQPVSGTVSITSNSAVNIAQMNGVTTTMGNGVAGTGVQRVAIASDNTAFTVNLGTAGSDPFGANADAASATGSISAKLRFIAATGIPITGTVTVGTHNVTNAGTFAVQATCTNAGTFAVQAACAGDVANGSSDSGNPLKVGGIGHTANPTAVTDGQRVAATFDKLGKQVCVGSIRDMKINQVTTITSSTSETTIVTAVASTFLDLYGLIISNKSATATLVTIKDSTSGTTQAIIYVPAGDTRGFMLPESAALKQTTVNNNWTATCGTSVDSVYITALCVKNT